MGRLASHHFSTSTPTHSSFYIAALLLTCAIRTTLGAYRQVSPGSAWTRLRSHGRVGGALHRKQAQRRSCRRQHSAEEYGPDGGSVRGGQVCPRHKGGLLTAKPSGKRRGREAVKASQVRGEKPHRRGRDKESWYGRTVYQHTTASTLVVHRGHLIRPKPDNRCSTWAVCSRA